jgi:hypothetical protein
MPMAHRYGEGTFVPRPSRGASSVSQRWVIGRTVDKIGPQILELIVPLLEETRNFLVSQLGGQYLQLKVTRV